MYKPAEVISVIRTELETRGTGEAGEDPVRIVTQYWSLDGELLIESDPYLERRYSQWLRENDNPKQKPR